MSKKHCVLQANGSMIKKRVAVRVMSMYVLCGFLVLAGCSSSNKKELATLDELVLFDRIGAAAPAVDMERVTKARVPIGPHRVVPQEVLELTMPTILSVVTSWESSVPQRQPTTALTCRINGQGMIFLPIIGELKVAGLTLPEIEALVIQAYYPTYTKYRPTVFARIEEKKTYRVSINGAVDKPGLYALPYDEMTLVSLLMHAGGIVDDGAATIRVLRDKSPKASSTTDTAFVQEPTALTVVPQSLSEGNVSIRFIPQPGQKPQGDLVVERQGCVLFQQELDLTNDGQRTAVLGDLARCQAGVDIFAMGTQLQQLAGMLEDDNARWSPASPFNYRVAESLATQLGDLQGSGLKYADTVSAKELEGNPLPVKEQETTVHLGVHKNIVLPVKGLNIPFVDVSLYEGDSVIVEKLQMPMFTVLGLVSKPGNFDYPPGDQFSLFEAIGFAGGLNPTLEPRYADIYRLQANGDIAHIKLDLKNVVMEQPIPSAMNVPIKPGDIVVIEHTAITRTRKFINNVFRLTFGIYLTPQNLGFVQ
ncbi:SLBB domain-containing protein [Planctomycetota bacterium]